MAEAASNLNKIEHIVVLMLENRSFDHMLGYLSLAGRTDVDGLKAEFRNSHDGVDYPVHHLTRTKFTSFEDPDHSGAAVDEQIGGGKMDGFVSSFAKQLLHKNAKDGDVSLVMGYY